jgi:hypothetical protein
MPQNQRHKEDPKEGPGGDNEIWVSEEVWEGPQAPPPCAVTHLVYAALLPPPTSAKNAPQGHVTAGRHPPPMTRARAPDAAVAPPPSQEPCARGLEEAGLRHLGQLPNGRSSRLRGRTDFLQEPILGGGVRPCLCGAEGPLQRGGWQTGGWGRESCLSFLGV